MRVVSSAITVFLLANAAGCAATATPPVAAAAHAPRIIHQLILRFKPASLACDTGGVARLAADAGVAIELVRPMSGGACVVRQRSFDDAAFAQETARLRRHPAIESIEQDRVMKSF